MYRGDLAVGALRRGPLGSRNHQLLDYMYGLRTCWSLPKRLHAVLILRRSPQAVRLQVHASVSTRCLTARRILEVAPYGYNL